MGKSRTDAPVAWKIAFQRPLGNTSHVRQNQYVGVVQCRSTPVRFLWCHMCDRFRRIGCLRCDIWVFGIGLWIMIFQCSPKPRGVRSTVLYIGLCIDGHPQGGSKVGYDLLGY